MSVGDELVLAVELKPDLPQDVMNVLFHINNLSLGDPNYRLETVPKHAFFEKFWDHYFNGWNAYFNGTSFISFRKKDVNEYHLTLRIVVRNGSSYIAGFLHWLAPYVVPDGFAGYTRTDVAEDIICHIHFSDNHAYYHELDLRKEIPKKTIIKLTREDGRWSIDKYK